MPGIEGFGDADGLPAGLSSERWVVKLDFLGANPDVAPESLEESGAVISYFKGRPEDWKAGLPASSKIVYRGLWPGIDLIYYGTFDRMKYEFIVQPGADPSRIKLVYRGAESVALTEEGRLAVATPVGGFHDDVPVAWQETKGGRADVRVAYALQDVPDAASGIENVPGFAGPETSIGDGLGSRNWVYGFEVGEYDRSLPLVLDPAIIIYCGYIGGDASEGGYGISVDNGGNAYVVGYTYSAQNTFPVTVGPDLTYNGGGGDGFVAKVNAAGTALVYCGYIGGSGWDRIHGVAIDSAGNAYVAGYTDSSQASFPVTVGPDLTYNGGVRDGFVAKVNVSGTALVYCGYIGGENAEEITAIAVDGAGNAYITGYTNSTQATFPVTAGPDLTYNGDTEAFVAKVNAAGTALIYCGYIGGSAPDSGSGIAVDGAGNAYVTGATSSTQATFPVTVGPDLTFNASDPEEGDAFVAKINASGTGLLYCGYIGGDRGDLGRAIAVDAGGNAYVTGNTRSNESTFPVTVGPDLTYNGGNWDAFVAKVNASGTLLIYCGYIGGGSSDLGYGIAVDAAGNAYVGGVTSSAESTFPVTVGPDLVHNGSEDGFIAKINAAGTALVYCGYIGGAATDAIYGIAVDAEGNAYVTGVTSSSQTTFPVDIGPDLTYNDGYSDAFVAKISAYEVPPPAVTSLLPSSAMAGDPAFVLSAVGTDFVDGAVVRWDESDRPTTFLNEWELNADIGTADLETGKIVEVTVLNPDGGLSNALEFTVNNPVPSLTSISPTKAMAGGPGFLLSLLGSNFVPGSVVRWRGYAIETTYMSGTELEAAVASGDIQMSGEVQVTVENSAPAGGLSNFLVFLVDSFDMDVWPVSQTVAAGQSATYNIELTPQYESFESEVTFSALGLPRGTTATFSPATVTPGSGSASTTLTLKTTARTVGQAGGIAAAAGHIPPSLGYLLLIPIFSLLLRLEMPVWAKVSRRHLATVALIICLVILSGGCSTGGGGDDAPANWTPPGTYQITVQGVSGNLTVSTTVTLVVQ